MNTYLIEKIKEYVEEKLQGDECVWEIKQKKHTWLILKHKKSNLELNLCVFRKASWQVGQSLERGGLVWKFKYTKKEIDNLETNERFIAAINRMVLYNIETWGGGKIEQFISQQLEKSC